MALIEIHSNTGALSLSQLIIGDLFLPDLDRPICGDVFVKAGRTIGGLYKCVCIFSNSGLFPTHLPMLFTADTKVLKVRFDGDFIVEVGGC